ncbi:MAG: SH3 domain-containing protein [Cyanobacteria bacterium P01_F01_bin.150]
MVRAGILAIAGRLLPLTGLLCLAACSGSTPPDAAQSVSQSPVAASVEKTAAENADTHSADKAVENPEQFPATSLQASADPALAPKSIAKASRQVPAQQTPASLGVDIFVAEPSGKGWLRTQNPEGKVNIRTQPTTDSAAPHYGLPGDPVTILKYTEHHQGHVWYFVRFEDTAVEGWVQDDLIEAYVSEADKPFAEAPGEDAIATDPIQATTSASGSYTDEEGYVGGFTDSGPITKTEEIVFVPGEQEKIIGGGTVAAGTIHEYFFSASPGQQITVELQIEENHDAAFQVQSKSFGYWSTAFSDYPGIAARHWSGMLPKSDGEQYRIVVGPINGNDASYLMRIVKE